MVTVYIYIYVLLKKASAQSLALISAKGDLSAGGVRRDCRSIKVDFKFMMREREAGERELGCK